MLRSMEQRYPSLGKRSLDWSNPFTVSFGALLPVAIAFDAAKPRGDIVLDAIQPDAALAEWYERELREFLKEMHDDVLETMRRLYGRNEPIIAQDAKPKRKKKLPANKFNDELDSLYDKWISRAKSKGSKLAVEFIGKANKSGDAKLKRMLKMKAGMNISFRITKQQRDVMQALIHENVSLIKSIPEKYLQQVEGAVMRSVAKGGDEQQLVLDIRKIYGVSKKRAVLISRDQSRKAANGLQRSRQLDLGVKEGIWMHSSAAKTPRPTHVKNNGKKFDLKKGWYDPAVKQYIQPGELPRCRCSFRPVIPGL